MAKENVSKLKNLIYIAIGIATLVGMFTSVVMAWGNLGNKINNNLSIASEIISDADDLEMEGCKPAKRNTLDIALTQKDITTIQKDIAEIKREQKQGFTDILDRLPR